MGTSGTPYLFRGTFYLFRAELSMVSHIVPITDIESVSYGTMDLAECELGHKVSELGS
jgi:hypothetical protein